jgi:hypothetical protein
MRRPRAPAVAAVLSIALAAQAGAQPPRPLSDAECQALRQRVAEHARLSDGVRRAVAAQAQAASAPASSAPRPAASGRAEAIRARLAEIPRERQVLEDQRLAAMVRFEFGRATEIQARIQALETERQGLERELATLPAGGGAPAGPAPATPRQLSDVERIRCQDLAAALDTAVRTRQRELGAREGQPGAVPLTALGGQSAEQIARDLAAQLRPWPDAATQVGLLDQDGDGRLDGFVDVPAADVYRLYRQRPDGTVSVEVFVAPGRSGAAYGEIVRRIEEAATRQARLTLDDLLSRRPAGPVRVVSETADFAAARGHLLAGNFAEAARLESAAARASEFQNFRGDAVRLVEVIAPAPGGVAARSASVLPRAGNQELWEESTTVVRPVSYWRTDVDVAIARETRSGAGAIVTPRAASAPVRFSIER